MLRELHAVGPAGVCIEGRGNEGWKGEPDLKEPLVTNTGDVLPPVGDRKPKETEQEDGIK